MQLSLLKILNLKSYMVIIFVILFLHNLSAQSDEKMLFSLKSAQDYAIQHNYDVRTSKYDMEAAKKQLNEVTAGGLPQISASIDYTNFLDIPTSLIPGEIFGGEPGSVIAVQFGRQHNVTAGLTADQLLFSASYFVGLRASRIFLQLNQQNLERSQTDIKETVSQTFYLILVVEENLAILQMNLENLQKTLFEVQERYKEGFVEETDVKQIQISVTRLENNINVVKRQRSVTYNLLKFQMGIDLSKEIGLSQTLADIIAQVNVPVLITREFNIRQNIDFRLFDTQERAAALSLSNEKAAFWPEINGFASYQRIAQRNEFDLFDRGKDWFPTTSIGVRIKIPIFSSGVKIFKVQRAKIALKQAQNNRRKIEQGLQLEYLKTKTELSSAYEKYRNSKNNLDLSKEVYDITLEKYSEGISSSVDLIQIHNQYLMAQTEYINSVSELLNTKNHLERLFNYDE
jgi:outer membrane protein TolC